MKTLPIPHVIIPALVRWRLNSLCFVALTIGRAAQAEESARADESAPGFEAIKAAVARSLPLLEKGAKTSMERRNQCFTCHNQGLTVMALRTAQTRGLTIDEENLRQQVQFTADFLAKNRSEYLEGRGQGGQVDTAGYALWALANGDWKPDATTAAVTEFLLVFQNDIDSWKPQSRRPPTEQSHFTSSHVALRGLKSFGTPEQRERIDRRFDQVRQWLIKTPPQDTEDRVSRLRALDVSGAAPDEITKAAQELLQTQRADGGWAQLDDMSSDAYATGTALVALYQAGRVATADPAYRKGLKYLISTQLDDGSWHVKTRSEPFQKYYESGYPHGEDQFISISAAGWSTTALALALPAGKEGDGSTESRPTRGIIPPSALDRWDETLASRAGAKAQTSSAPSKLVLPNTETFNVADRPAFVFLPPDAKRIKPQPWIFYAPTLPGYPDEAERWMHEQFLAAGIAVAGVDVGEAYGSPKSHAAFDALHRELTEHRGFAAKSCLFGRSRGGLWISSWAIAHPERVGGLIGIYPVFDFRSYPKLDKAASAYGVTPDELTARNAELNPIERIGVLARARIPAALIHGDIDAVVPIEENSAEFVRRYKESGAESLVKLIVLEGQGHNFFEGFFRSQELVDFAVARAKAGAQP
ncbi:MAG: prolyl oligopeptidase family serine peptidase [Verrucomicrobiales bacterium]